VGEESLPKVEFLVVLLLGVCFGLVWF